MMKTTGELAGIVALALLGAGPVLISTAPLHAQEAGDRALFESAEDGDVEAVAELLHEDFRLSRATDESGRTALHYAAARGHENVARLLLEAGAEIDATEEDGETPLHYAAWRSQQGMGALLIGEGAGLEVPNHWGRTPLLIVARETGNVEFAELLIDADAEVNARDRGGESSLDLAAWRGFAQLVDLLLDSGAELPPADSRQARMLAQFSADKGLVRLFGLSADAGVDLDLRNENGGTLLHSASQGGAVEIVARLLAEGFEPDVLDRYGRTPLHYAAEMGHQEVAGLLLEHGAGIDVRSLGGETPFNTARQVERQEMAAYLAAAGADTAPRQFPELIGPYMGQEPPAPGDEPRLFAPDIVSTHRFQHGTISFSPAGNEAFWASQIAIQETGYSQGLILTSRIEDGRWTEPAPAPFSELGLQDDVPIYSVDGNRLYFLSTRLAPGEQEGQGERIWFVERTAGVDPTNGDRAAAEEAEGWSEPRIVYGGPNTLDLHWLFSAAADGSLYVPSRGDLYVSRFEDGRWLDPEPIGEPVNSEAEEAMPFIAPDGSYLLFTRFGHPENMDFADLWISFRDPGATGMTGGWSEPLNLGSPVNEIAGICPIVTSDGRYLFFNGGSDDNYWVDAGLIERLRVESDGR